MHAERERFTPNELAVVLSHYDCGVITSAREFARGSRRAPKLLLTTQSGRFLLKRRAHGRDRPERVALAHRLLAHLKARGFPAPGVVPTRDGETVLHLDVNIYEMFEFVDGELYDGSLGQTADAGQMLARYHLEIGEFLGDGASRSSFHDANVVRDGLNSIPTTTSSHDSVVGHEAELLSLTQSLYEAFDAAAARVNALGFAGWPTTLIHGDWHPGNMLFRGGQVSAVLDFDSVRHQPAVVDLANGMLQFSILRGHDQPESWPDFFDESRMRRFWMGYLARRPLAPAARGAVPDLMSESLIAESVVPIAATGSFGRMPGFGVLQMVRRKVRWLELHRERMQGWLLEE